MKECIIDLSYLAVALVTGVVSAIMIRRYRPAKPLTEEEYCLVAALALAWPLVLVVLAGIATVRGFAVAIRLVLRVVDAVALKMKWGDK